MRRSASCGRLSMRRPPSRISPPAMRPGGSMRPMIAAPVIDLPAPDSPTTPSTSPAAIDNETSSTAVSVPRRVGNSTRRCSTIRSGSVRLTLPPNEASGRENAANARGAGSAYRTLPARRLLQPRIERVAKPIAEQIDRQHHGDQRRARKNRDPPLARKKKVITDADQRPQRWLRRRDADAEER